MTYLYHKGVNLAKKVTKSLTAIYKERQEKILNALSPYVDKLAELEITILGVVGQMNKIQSDIYADRKAKLFNCIRTTIASVCSNFALMTYDEVGDITVADIQVIVSVFKELIMKINTDILFTPTKQTFTQFAGITSNQYNYLLNCNGNDRDPIALAMQDLDAFIFDMQVSAAEQGTQNEKSTIYRTQAKKHGQSIQVEKNNELSGLTLIQNKFELKSPDKYMQELLTITGGSVK